MTNKTMFGVGILVIIAVAIAIFFINYANKKETVITQDIAKKLVEYKSAIIKTNMGDIEVEFFVEKAPLTVTNFTGLADIGFYDGTKFHRVIKDFMIQSGDPLSKDDTKEAEWGTGGPGYAFKDEINDEKLVRGAIAMANSGPNTNGSQFFIVTAQATPWLDGKHTVFGKVVGGMDVVLAISGVATETGDRPVEPVVVEKIILK
ncbi:MAG: peptidylprolyl isomerase [Patescibacteria group bacterium]